jgi:ribose-phosphate pyrophosphokinase
MAANTKIFSGSAHPELSKQIVKKIGRSLGDLKTELFPDGEWSVWVDEYVNNTQSFVIQPTSPSVNSNLLELCLIADALRREGARIICAVIPYFGYARQERQTRPGEPVSAKVAADLLVVSGVSKVITVDLHAEAIGGFFNVPVSHLSALEVLAEKVKKEKLVTPVVISPDVGGVRRARNFAYFLDYPIAVVEKRRFFERRDKTEVLTMGGDVKDKSAIIVDDLISTGGTIVENARILKKAGVKRIIVCATHPVFTGKYKENLGDGVIEKVIVTDTIPIPKVKKFKNLEVVSCARLLADAIISDHL